MTGVQTCALPISVSPSSPVIPQVELGGKVSIPSAVPLLAGPGVSLQLLLAAQTAEVGAPRAAGALSRVRRERLTEERSLLAV